jgi:hypothetical protein
MDLSRGVREPDLGDLRLSPLLKALEEEGDNSVAALVEVGDGSVAGSCLMEIVRFTSITLCLLSGDVVIVKRK